jgi:hypothetical protein
MTPAAALADADSRCQGRRTHRPRATAAMTRCATTVPRCCRSHSCALDARLPRARPFSVFLNGRSSASACSPVWRRPPCADRAETWCVGRGGELCVFCRPCRPRTRAVSPPAAYVATLLLIRVRLLVQAPPACTPVHMRTRAHTHTHIETDTPRSS